MTPSNLVDTWRFRSNLFLQSPTLNLLPPIPLQKKETSGTSQNFSTHLPNYTASHPTHLPLSRHIYLRQFLNFSFPEHLKHQINRKEGDECLVRSIRRVQIFFLFFLGGGGLDFYICPTSLHSTPTLMQFTLHNCSGTTKHKQNNEL